MILQDLLNVIAESQTVRVFHHFETVYTGFLEDWDDMNLYKDCQVDRVYVGVFGTLTIVLKTKRITK